MPMIVVIVLTFGWYSVVGRRVAPPIDTESRTVLSPDGIAGFTTDGTTLLSTI